MQQQNSLFGNPSNNQNPGAGLFGVSNQTQQVSDQQRQQMNQLGGTQQGNQQTFGVQPQSAGGLFSNTQNQSAPQQSSLFSQQPQSSLFSQPLQQQQLQQQPLAQQQQQQLQPQQQNQLQQQPNQLFGNPAQVQQQPIGNFSQQPLNQPPQPFGLQIQPFSLQSQPAPSQGNSLFGNAPSNQPAGGMFNLGAPQSNVPIQQNPVQSTLNLGMMPQIQQPNILLQAQHPQANPILQPQSGGLFVANPVAQQPFSLNGQQAQQGTSLIPAQIAPVPLIATSSNQPPTQQPPAAGGMFFNRLNQGPAVQPTDQASPIFPSSQSQPQVVPVPVVQNVLQRTVPLTTQPVQQVGIQSTAQHQPQVLDGTRLPPQQTQVGQQGAAINTFGLQRVDQGGATQQKPEASVLPTQTVAPTTIPVTQPLARQPIPAPVQVVVAQKDLPLHDNNQIIQEIQSKSEKALIKVLNQKGVKERLIQGCQFYQINGTKQAGLKRGTFEDDLRTLLFDDCLPQQQFDAVLKCANSELLTRLRKNYQSDKKDQLAKARIPILVALAHQRVTIVHALICLLEKPCIMEDREGGIVINRDLELTSFIVELFQTRQKDANSKDEPDRSLLEYLVVNVRKGEETLEFYLKSMGDAQDQYVLWQMYNSIAQEQLGILRIFILVSQYYAGSFDLLGYKKQCFALMKTLISSKMQGIINNPKLFRLITNQQYVQSLLKLGELIETTATLFLFSIAKLPGQQDFVLEQEMGDKYKTNIRRQDDFSRNVQDKPGYMLFSAEFSANNNEYINGLKDLCPLWVRMIECLAQSFLSVRSSLAQNLNDEEEFLKKCERLYDLTYRDNKNHSTQLQSILHMSRYEEDDQALSYAIKRCLSQWLAMFATVKTKLCQEVLDVQSLAQCCDIQCKLLHNNNVLVDQFWSNYEEHLNHGTVSGDVSLLLGARGNYSIVPLLTQLIGVPEQQCKHKHVPLRSPLESVVQFLQEQEFDQPNLWNEELLQPLLKFAVQPGPLMSKSFNQEGMGRRSNASMDFYQQQNYKPQDLKPAPSNIITDRALEDTIQLLAVAKFLKKLACNDASKLQNAEAQMGLSFLEMSYWPILLTLLKALCSCTSWCYAALQLSDPRALQLVTYLFRLSTTLLAIINATLECESTSQRSAYTIGLFGALFAGSQQSQTSWHPILEVQDLLSKYEASQLQGINPDCEKAAYKVQVQLLRLLKIVLQMTNPLDYFPLGGKQQGGFFLNQNEIESSLKSLKDQFPTFLSSLLVDQNFEGEGQTLNFARQFEIVLSRIEMRRQGVESDLVKNLLDVLSQIIFPNFARYLDGGSSQALGVLQESLEILQLILQRFIRNPFRCVVVQDQLPPTDNPQAQFIKLLSDSLNAINLKGLIATLLSPLDMQIDLQFFADADQSYLGTTLRKVGLTNVLWASVGKAEVASSTHLKQSVVQLLIETLSCLTQLVRLSCQQLRDTTSDSQEINVVQLMHQHLSNNDLYFFRKSYDNEVYQLSLVHGILACLNITQEGLPARSSPMIDLRDDTQQFQAVYAELNINSRTPTSLIHHRGTTRATSHQNDVYCAAMRLLSTLVTSQSLHGHKETAIENLIVQVMQERHQNSYQAVTVKHVLSQFLTTLVKRFFDAPAQQIIDTLEFLIVCIEHQQNVVTPLLKQSSYNKKEGGVVLFISALAELPDVNATPLDKQHIDMLTIMLLSMLLERQNQFSKFADLCRSAYQKHFIKLMSNILVGLGEPYFSLQSLMALRDQALSNSVQGVLKHFLTRHQVDEVTHSDLYQQVVLEQCLIGATTQSITLEYFLRVLLKELKSESASEVYATLLKDFFLNFEQWVVSLISLLSITHDSSLEHINKILPIDRSIRLEVQVTQRLNPQSIIDQVLQLNQFGMGRDSLVDTQDLLALLTSWDVPTDQALKVAASVQRYNMLESLLRCSQSCLTQLHQTIAITISSGTDGIPISCLPSNNIQYVNAFRPDVLKSIMQVFNRQPKLKTPPPEYETTIKLAKLMLIPNSTQILIPKGFIAVVSGESSSKNVEKAYRALLSMLFQVSRCLHDNIGEATPPQSAIQILMELYAGISLLLDYQSEAVHNSPPPHDIHLIKAAEWDTLMRHQVAVWGAIIVNGVGASVDMQLTILQGYCYFICLMRKAALRIEPNELLRTTQKHQKDIGQDINHIIVALTTTAQRRNDDGTVYLLAYILSATLQIYPEIMREFLLSELDNSSQDATKLMLNKIRGKQSQNFIFQAVLLFWINVCQQLDMAAYLCTKRNILDVLKHHPDFLNIKDEPIYSVTGDSMSFTHNHKHIMWCYTLILVRECSFGDTECLRVVCDFLQIYKKRIFSALLSIDRKNAYQSLTHLTQATGVQFGEFTTLQPGLYYLQELQHTIALLTTLIHQPSLRVHFPTEHDKITYHFANLILHQVTCLKGTKQIIQSFVKPFTLFEVKLNQQDLAVNSLGGGGGDQRLKQSVELSPSSSPNLQTLRRQYHPNMGVSTPKRLDLMSDHKSLSRATSFQIRPTDRMDQELSDLTPFQLMAACEFVNIWQMAILGLTSALEQKDISENHRASLQLPFEANYWVDLGESLVRFIYVNLELLVNLSRFSQAQNLLNYINLVNSNLDYQIQHGGLNLMTKYPTTKTLLIQQLISNIVMGVQAAYQHLQLRELYREVRFIKESFEMELAFVKQICKYIELVSKETEVKHFSDQYLNEIYYHDLHDEAGSYWQVWKDKFDIIVSK